MRGENCKLACFLSTSVPIDGAGRKRFLIQRNFFLMSYSMDFRDSAMSIRRSLGRIPREITSVKSMVIPKETA